MNDQCLNCRIRKSCYYKEPEEDWTCEHYGYFNGLLGEIDKVENGGEEVTNEQIGEAYQRGLDDTWEAARKIGHASQMLLKEMGFEFNSNEWSYNPSWYVVMNYTAAEAIEKIKAYEEKPKTDDLISRQSAIDAIDEYMVGKNCATDGTMMARLINELVIKQLPQALPKRGKWIEDKGQQTLMKNNIAKGEVWRVCSVCGAGHMIGHKYECDKAYHDTHHNFCPNCGADMREGE